MSPTEDNARNMFCVCYTDVKFGQKFYLNFVSDSRGSSSIRLPDFMIRMSQLPGMKMDELEESAEFMTNQRQMEASIRGSLNAWYGQSMPTIHLTEDGEALVMNVHILEGHAEALTRLPLREPKTGPYKAKWEFLSTIMIVIKLRILSIVDPGNKLLWAALPKFKMTMMTDRVRMPTGERATPKRISKVVRLAPEDMISPGEAEDRQREALIPRWPIRVDDKLFSIGYMDEQLQRSLYFNIVASDRSDSLRLAPFMLDIARSATRQEARALAKTIEINQVFKDLSQHVDVWLANYHRRHQVQVFVAKNNDNNLVFNVPLHIEHAPLLPKCFPGTIIMFALGSALKNGYASHFVNVRGRCDDIEMNRASFSITDHTPQATGRRATSKEIYSLLFKPKGAQPSHDHIFERLDMFMVENNIHCLDERDQDINLGNTIYDARER